ncbi:MAG: uracil-DNA glycosylase [Candidatus Hodarchaeota archaeon]
MTCKWYRVCPVKWFTDSGRLSRKWVDEYCLEDDGFKKCVRYEKEEKGEYHPDNMLPDGNIDDKLK